MAGTSTSTYANSSGYGLAAQAVAYAGRFLGVPYIYGGTTPSGFDCSGLVQYVYEHLGVSLPRTSQEQASAGTPVAPGSLQPGDLIFYNEPGEGPNSHVAIYAGNGSEIEAPRPGENVQVEKIDWTHFAGARRVATGTGSLATGTSGLLTVGDVTPTGDTATLGTGTITDLLVKGLFIAGAAGLLVLGATKAFGGGK